MSSANQHTASQSLANPRNAFNTFSADQFLEALAVDGGINITDGLSVWDRPASESSVVREGLITNVPASWTYGRLMVHCMQSKIGTQAVQMSIAKVAIYKAHEATCLARAATAAAEALRQEAQDAANAATDAIQAAEQCDRDGKMPDDSVKVVAAIDIAESTRKAAEEAMELATVKKEHAAKIADDAEVAIKKVPSAKETYLATLAPDFAHLGDVVDDGPDRPPKRTFDRVPADLFGFVCTGCKVYNLVRSGEKKWYVVFVGTKVGIFHGNARAMMHVSGIRSSVHRGFFTIEEAETAFAAALVANAVRVVE